MRLSGPATPASVSLLPQTPIAVLRSDRIVATLEDVWGLPRDEYRLLPPEAVFVSGPSRSAGGAGNLI